MIKWLEKLSDLTANYLLQHKSYGDDVRATKLQINETFATLPGLDHLSVRATDEGMIRISPNTLHVFDGGLREEAITISYEDILAIAAALQKDMD